MTDCMKAFAPGLILKRRQNKIFQGIVTLPFQKEIPFDDNGTLRKMASWKMKCFAKNKKQNSSINLDDLSFVLKPGSHLRRKHKRKQHTQTQ